MTSAHYLEFITSAREEAKLLDLKLSQSEASGSPYSSIYSLPEPLESLLRLQRYEYQRNVLFLVFPLQHLGTNAGDAQESWRFMGENQYPFR